jgi:hypothetical protein
MGRGEVEVLVEKERRIASRYLLSWPGTSVLSIPLRVLGIDAACNMKA